MGRIRTIKPETPHSESLGRCTRDARLCFIFLWTLADDSGKLRGSSRMLASLLFPYDDDAPRLIDGWLAELEAQDCVRRHIVDSAHYVQIVKWSEHQKIDHPSKSRFPDFDESSRMLASPREPSGEDQGRDQGSRTKEGTKDLSLRDKAAEGQVLELQPVPPKAKPEPDVDEVMQHYLGELKRAGKHPRDSEAGRNLIRKRRKDGVEVHVLKDAISGLTWSEFHRDQGFTALKYAIRNDDQIQLMLEKLAESRRPRSQRL